MKILKYLCVVAVVTLLVYSCKKDKQEDNDFDVEIQQNVRPTLDELKSAVEKRIFQNAETELFFKGQNPTGFVSKRDGEIIPEALVASQMLYEAEQDFPFVADLLDGLGAPCWECAETEEEFTGFNVSVPFYNDSELTAVLAFMDFNPSDDYVDTHLRLKKFNNELLEENFSVDELYFSYLMQKYESFTQNLTEADDRGCNCPQGSYANWWGNNNGTTVIGVPPGGLTNSLCFCFNFNGTPSSTGNAEPQDNNCCGEDGYTQNYLDGQPFEWGIQIQGAWDAWLFFLNNWIGIFDNLPNGPHPGGGSSTSSNTTVQLLTDIMNEQIVLGFLMNHLKSYKDDLPFDFKIVLGGNHDLAGRIYLYLKNYYDDVSPSILHVIDIIHLYSEHPEMSMLTPAQIEHILIFEPALSNAINNYLNNSNLNNTLALLAVEGLLTAQMSSNQQGIVGSVNLPNSFHLIYNFYVENGNGVFAGLSSYAIANLQKKIFTYLLLHPSITALQKEAVAAYVQLYTSGNYLIGHGTVEDFVDNYVTLEGELDPVFNFSEEEEEAILANNAALKISLFISENESEDESEKLNNSVKLFTKILAQGELNGPYLDNYQNILAEDAELIPNTYLFHLFYTLECAKLRFENPSWGEIRIGLQATFNVLLDGSHLALDIAGLVPAIGEVADLTNGIIYTLEGDGVNAAFSFSSMIPIAGWFSTGAKWAQKIVIGASGRKIALKFIVDSNNIIRFGYRGQLKTVIKPLAGHQAHHIIPWEKLDHPLVQKAAKDADAFHPNSATNGIGLPSSAGNNPNNLPIHNGSHANYSTQIEAEMTTRFNNNPNMSSAQAKAEMESIIQHIRTELGNNPNIPINQINLGF